uniref:(California timema) hypothetical protein n=1 Tax=Timema californicum TaxID=61474 RepID=A0A7R9J468_TIMCA|nr:unnamed protein product [Timema californicum]
MEYRGRYTENLTCEELRGLKNVKERMPMEMSKNTAREAKKEVGKAKRNCDILSPSHELNMYEMNDDTCVSEQTGQSHSIQPLERLAAYVGPTSLGAGVSHSEVPQVEGSLEVQASGSWRVVECLLTKPLISLPQTDCEPLGIRELRKGYKGPWGRVPNQPITSWLQRQTLTDYLQRCEHNFFYGRKIAFPEDLSLLLECEHSSKVHRAHHVWYLKEESLICPDDCFVPINNLSKRPDDDAVECRNM